MVFSRRDIAAHTIWLAAVGFLSGCTAGGPADEVAAVAAGAGGNTVSSMDPDLVVRSVVGPPSASPWGYIEVQVEVCNQGGGWAPPSEVAVVASADDVVDELDHWLSTALVWDLAPGGCERVTAVGPVPNLLGSYVLAASADWYQHIPEGDETNNDGAGNTLHIGHDPDLVVEHVRGPATAAPHAEIAIDVRVCNHGQSWAPGAGVELYLSSDDQITIEDMPIGWLYIGDLAPGSCRDESVPAWPDMGVYVLGAIVDPQQQIVELDENNNTLAGDSLHVGWDPDLVITAVDPPPSVVPGHVADVSVTVCNQGQSYSAPTHLELFISEDEQLDPMVDPWAGVSFMDYLEPGQCAQARVPVHFYGGASSAYRIGALVDRDDYIDELIEDNNTRLSELVGVGYDPDLVVVAVTGPTSALPWDTFEATARVCNQGQGPSWGTSVNIHIPGSGMYQPGPYPGMSWVPPLMPGACANASGPVYGPGEPGAYVLRAVVDPERSVHELIESNNTGEGQRIAIGYDPDLVVTAVTPPPGTFMPYSDTVVIARVCNHGQAPSWDTYVDLYVSRDARLSSNDVMVGGWQVPWLQQGACASVPIPAYLHAPEEGAYFLIAEVDGSDYVVEIIEDNNTGASDRVGIGHSADLVVAAIEAPPSAQPGAGFEVAVTVCNRGHTTSGHTDVELFASSSTQGGPAPGFDAPLGQALIEPLPPGQCATQRIPASIYGPDGRYQLRAVVDRWNNVSEIIEDNNTLIDGVMGVGYDADLIVTELSGPPSAQPGASVQLLSRVCNQGQGTSYGTAVEVYFSTDEDISAPGDMPAGWGDVGQLAPGACADMVMFGYAPSQPGAYVLGAIVDPYQSQYELIEDNNTLVGERIGVGWDADLVVASVSGPPSAQPGMDFTVTAQVCNQGQGPSWGSMLEVVLSADADVGSEDMVIGDTPVPMLEPGVCQSVSTTARAQVYEGVYTLGAVVRADGGPELIADNNGRASGLLGVGHDPDLVVTAVTGPASAPTWGQFVVTVQACNQGQGHAVSASIEVVLSSTGTISSSDIAVGSGTLSPLAPGGCQNLYLSVYPFQPEGSYVLAARVDPTGEVWELIETNNSSAGATITLTP